MRRNEVDALRAEPTFIEVNVYFKMTPSGNRSPGQSSVLDGTANVSTVTIFQNDDVYIWALEHK